MNAYEFVLALVFLVVVVPTWLHYRNRHNKPAPQPGPPPEDENTLNELRAVASRLEDRVRTLERVLDAEAPGWRAKV